MAFLWIVLSVSVISVGHSIKFGGLRSFGGVKSGGIKETAANLPAHSFAVPILLHSFGSGHHVVGRHHKSLSSSLEGNANWWQKSVIYQIYPRSFKDSNGDGIGDINGITSKLDYLSQIGIDAIWLSPIFKSPMVDFGYDISDFRDIDPVFGSMSDFDNLRKKSKKKGIKLILDFVPNHSSDRHEWFQKSMMNESKYRDYYVWANARMDEDTYERLPPNNWVSVFGGSAWTWNEDRGQYYFHQYTSSQPDLNFRNPDVVTEIKDVMKYWLDKDVDGFRMDAVSRLFEDKELRNEKRSNDPKARPGDYNALVHNLTSNHPENIDMVVQWRALLEEYSKKNNITRLMMVEAHGSLNDTMVYYGNVSHPGAHLPFNFQLMSTIRNGSDATNISYVIQNYISHLPIGKWGNWVIGNHDTSRVASRLGRDMVDSMNMLALLLPGTAVTYNGEEIGMEDTFISWENTVDPRGLNYGRRGYLNHSRDPERTPFQWDDSSNAGFSGNKTWLPVNQNYKLLNLKNEMKSVKSHYNTYKLLVTARKLDVIQRGHLNFTVLSKNVFSFSRELNGSDAFLIVINVGTEMTNVDLSVHKSITGNLTVYAASKNSLAELDVIVNRTFVLHPKEALVLTNRTSKIKNSAAIKASTSVSLLLAAIFIVLTCSVFEI